MVAAVSGLSVSLRSFSPGSGLSSMIASNSASDVLGARHLVAFLIGDTGGRQRDEGDPAGTR